MKAYRMTCVSAIRYAGSQAEVREFKRVFKDKFNTKPADINIEEIEIPTNKVDLLDFLNEAAEATDASVE